MTETRKGEWMQTASGGRYWPDDPKPEDIHLADIATALSRVCRFGGHGRAFYSVAQHSVLVSHEVKRRGGSLQDQQWGLLHDASEAYLGDVVWPLKRSPLMAGYKELERRSEVAIAKRFGLPVRDERAFGLDRSVADMPPIIKLVDLVLLSTEKRDIMGGADEHRPHKDRVEAKKALEEGRLGGSKWHSDDFAPLPGPILPLGPADAERLFIGRAGELGIR